MKRNYLLQILFLGILLLLQSCDPEIKNDTRILIKGNIVDSANNPIPNISVRCQARYAVLGEAISDANGQFQFTSLEVEAFDSLNILVNIKPGSNYYNEDYGYPLIENTNYSAKQYFNNFHNRPATTYNLGTVQLNEAAQLTIFFNNIPGDNNSVSYKLEYDSAICQIDLNLNNSEDCNYLQDDYYQLLDITSSSFETNLESQLNTTVLLKYKLNNEPEETISIPLTNLENTHVFEF